MYTIRTEYDRVATLHRTKQNNAKCQMFETTLNDTRTIFYRFDGLIKI